MCPSHPNIDVLRAWGAAHKRTVEIQPGITIATTAEAKPHLTSYGYYVMNNWRDGSCHFDTTGPVGCFLAHRHAWNICVTRNEAVWIFEEGVSAYTTADFDELDQRYPHLDLVLGHSIVTARLWRQCLYRPQQLNSLLTAIDKIYYGTKCYRVSPAFARQLLVDSHRFDTHVDTYISTQAMMFRDTFQSARTTHNIVEARSVKMINHSLDHNMVVVFTLSGLVLVVSVLASLMRLLYVRCRRSCG